MGKKTQLELKLTKSLYLERVAGIEPAASAWKAEVLPLYDTRNIHFLQP